MTVSKCSSGSTTASLAACASSWPFSRRPEFQPLRRLLHAGHTLLRTGRSDHAMRCSLDAFARELVLGPNLAAQDRKPCCVWCGSHTTARPQMSPFNNNRSVLMVRRHLLWGVGAALVAAACSDANTPTVPHPLFSFSSNG